MPQRLGATNLAIKLAGFPESIQNPQDQVQPDSRTFLLKVRCQEDAALSVDGTEEQTGLCAPGRCSIPNALLEFLVGIKDRIQKEGPGSRRQDTRR